MSEPRAVAALLDGLVDYAGLFPPAAISMRDATAAYACYVAGQDRAKLGRFVVPVARLAELVTAVDALPLAQAPGSNAPWRLSVLAGAADAATLTGFDAAHGGRLVIDTVEAKADSVTDVEQLGAALGRRYFL